MCLQESRAHALQVVSDTDSLQQALRESKAQLAVVTSEAQQSLQSISLLQSEVAELKEALAMARKDFSSQQAQLASVTRDWEGAADDITKWKRAAQEAKDASDRYSKRIVDLTAEYEAEVCEHCMWYVIRGIYTHVFLVTLFCTHSAAKRSTSRENCKLPPDSKAVMNQSVNVLLSYKHGYACTAI